jgi:hypothetical protein
VTLPVIGQVKLPSADHLAFLGGLGALAAVGFIEWPVAAVVGVGHALTHTRRSTAVQDFGEALEDA